MKDIEITDLRVLCCVARLSSFVATAQELGISPAYVSKRVAEFEQRLGVTLFHRTTRRVHLSAQGEAAYAWARKILEDVDGLSAEMSNVQAVPSGPLRVSTSLRLGRNHVSPILARLGQAYPGLEIWLELVNSRMNMIDENIDIDIRVGEVAEQNLIAQRIVKSERILCASHAYLEKRGAPASVAELAQHDCLLFRGRDQPFGVWRLKGPGGVESTKVSGRAGSNHGDIIRNWALDGFGIIMLSDWDVAADLASGALVRVLPDHAQPADVMAVTTIRSASSAKIRHTMEFLVSELREGRYSLRGSGT
ncbi:MAG: LysR family transcriptional regulator [Candidatus Accumulibacter sp.]|jgi:LysR family transcriptional activator of dmlA|nr:LysR family transcriptional regulator [Accumulibacter sp.]